MLNLKNHLHGTSIGTWGKGCPPIMHGEKEKEFLHIIPGGRAKDQAGVAADQRETLTMLGEKESEVPHTMPGKQESEDHHTMPGKRESGAPHTMPGKRGKGDQLTIRGAKANESPPITHGEKGRDPLKMIAMDMQEQMRAVGIPMSG